ncbi:L-threonylcarbamoyladenylate synthase [Sphingorhabdus arenilitoris]|uniref:Threonylcarbamoyl-AMP synthase n=1 Tax=Sphingorhabdus arenilitoris TaxID=1490041 RepID=A0ABV8RH78_9SPHN
MPAPNTLGNSGIFPVTDSAILAASDLLRAGAIVAVPTETVYGLAADASNADAVAAIYRTKGRPDFNPLIVHVPDMAAAQSLAQFDDRAKALASAFWPGPLTLVLPLAQQANVAAAVTAGLPTIALRCPAHAAMQQLLRVSGLCLAAPSANRSGGISPTRAAHVAASLGGAAPMILDGGPCSAGLESTIIALRPSGWQMLRQGPVTEMEAQRILGCPSMPVTSAKIEAPGQLAGHYAPNKPLRLNAETAQAGEWHIGFGAIEGDDNLSAPGDLAQAAARLFDALHIADASSSERIAVAPIPQSGIGAAIHDRLKRAASS